MWKYWLAFFFLSISTILNLRGHFREVIIDRQPPHNYELKTKVALNFEIGYHLISLLPNR